MAGLKFVPQCKEVKLLEATTICSSLETISSLHIPYVVIESKCLEVVNLLNDAAIDFSKVSFIVKVKDHAKVLETVNFAYIHQSQNALAQCVVH